MFSFGLVTLLQGFVTNYAGLLTTRFFLGAFEAGMFPGCKLTPVFIHHPLYDHVELTEP
jgi:MFS family permease